jgi:GNAT superfamily N-acetyltransferase
MYEIIPYSHEDHKVQFFELNLEYVNWVAGKYRTVHNIDLESVNGKSNEDYVNDFLKEFTKIEPPCGQILLISVEEKIVGMGAITQLESGIGEIKRMYIQPQHQGQGMGKKLFLTLIERGREFGYSMIRLETADFFEAARHLYKSVGFHDIEEYAGGEVSLCLRKTTRYMEMKL